MSESTTGDNVTKLVNDYNKQANYMPHVKNIMRHLMVQDAGPQQDMQQATDLVCISFGHVAVRARSTYYLTKYPNQITIRVNNGNGNGGAWSDIVLEMTAGIRVDGIVSELPKIMRGYADHLFYCFADEKTGDVKKWCISNLDVIRERLPSYANTTHGQDVAWGLQRVSRDDPSQFLWLDTTHPMWAGLVVTDSTKIQADDQNRWVL